MEEEEELEGMTGRERQAVHNAAASNTRGTRTGKGMRDGSRERKKGEKSYTNPNPQI